MTESEFIKEKSLIESVLEPEELVSITKVNDREISVIVTPDEYIQSYVRPMMKINYALQIESSNTIRLTFHKKLDEDITLTLEQSNG